ncbi:Oidioi.mRNA.OKI2018_I69.XSR.g14979.t2.cds [Oikopleura dioica]|uniref:Oidioi.mRNA.OKI2018_I69.XSR.g14979.t2.cds n=1 Tax=Oikopleura dioica TaxID=34765 RepID=A0ABN7SFG0_OIKDI|nr:Oidioi.mRNA.OKI2018_I69.XSR.g14979.t2.cds [Oikopleura dioica]
MKLGLTFLVLSGLSDAQTKKRGGKFKKNKQQKEEAARLKREIKAFVLGQCVTVAPSKRVDCGYEGISIDRCQARGCCWDDGAGSNVPWCFHGKSSMDNAVDLARLVPQKSTCSGDAKQRKNCGWNRITPQECESIGCCFDDSVPRVPWCSYKQPDKNRPISKLTPKVAPLFCEKPDVVGKTGYNYACTDGFRQDSTCTITCANGLSGMGRAWKITCESPQRGWIGETPSCDPSKCYFPPSPANGIRTCSRVASVFPGSGYDYQYVCTFACDEGYQLQGAQQRSCPSNFGNKASWTHASPKCVKYAPNTESRWFEKNAGCPGLERPDSRTEIKCEPSPVFGKLNCEASCPAEFLRVVGAPRLFECSKNLKDPRPIVPVCASGYCSKFPMPENGTVNCTRSEMDGSVCTVSCNGGFNLIGEKQYRCNRVNWMQTSSNTKMENEPQCVYEELFSEGECSLRRSATTRIFGGSAASEKDFMITIRYGEHFKCGGVMIADQWAITAAHCVQGAFGRIHVHHDSRNSKDLGPEVSVERIVTHPNFNRRSQHDIALIKLVEPLSSADIVCLPEPEFNLPNGEIVQAYGYGKTSSSSGSHATGLQMGRIEYIPPSECGFIRKRFDYENLFCGMSPADTCDGDSGGPVLFRSGSSFKLVGIVSSGICESKNPGLYVRVSKFIPWIHETIFSQQ